MRFELTVSCFVSSSCEVEAIRSGDFTEDLKITKTKREKNFER